MSNTAVQLTPSPAPAARLRVLTGGGLRYPSPLIPAVILALLQILDGGFTLLGVSEYGASVEGNFLVRTLINELGVIGGICSAKVVALVIILALVTLNPKVRWLKSAMSCLCVVYLVGAILPWSVLLWSRYVL